MGLNLGSGATWTFWTQPKAKVFQQTFADASQLRYVPVDWLRRTGTACETSAVTAMTSCTSLAVWLAMCNLGKSWHVW